MPEIFIEEPCFAAAGKVHTRDGGLVTPDQVCPHGYRRSITCGCSNPLGLSIRTPSDAADCQGRIFPPDPFQPPHGTTCH